MTQKGMVKYRKDVDNNDASAFECVIGVDSGSIPGWGANIKTLFYETF